MRKTIRDGEVMYDSEKGLRLMGMPPKWFAIFALSVLGGCYLGVLPNDMIGGFAVAIVIGTIFGFIGDNIPIFNDYLGGGPVLALFGSAIFAYFNFFPEPVLKVIGNWTQDTQGFINFYIAALICGSIMGMDRRLLVEAGWRYFIPLIGGVVVAYSLTGLVGSIMGYGWKEAVLYVAAPIMGGGTGAGAIPMSKIYGTALQVDSGQIFGIIFPAVALGNAVAIIAAALLNRVGVSFPKLSGNGIILKGFSFESTPGDKGYEFSMVDLGTGLLMACSFYIFGRILEKVIPLHYYALTIITVAVVKISGVVPKKMELAAAKWYQFTVVNLTLALMAGTGVRFLDIGAVINALTPTYLILTIATVLGAILGSGIVGSFVKFYFIESSLTAGLCMANMGGTGDVAVLSAAKRMNLMPFAQMSSRLGGAFILVLQSILIRFLF